MKDEHMDGVSDTGVALSAGRKPKPSICMPPYSLEILIGSRR